MNIRNIIPASFSALTLLIAACNNSPRSQYSDTPTSGEINIVVDESYQPLMQVELDTFLKIYKYANIHARYLPESDVFNQLLNNDSIRLAITARELNEAEKNYFNNRKIIPRINKIAIDAVALVINKTNADTLMRYEELKKIITGQIRKWNELSPKGNKDTIRIVFDRSGSSNTRYLSEKFLDGKTFPDNSYATNSNAEVVEYVSKTPSALGIISVNWISDRDDPEAQKFLSKVNVIALSPPDTAKDADQFYQPYQAYIALRQYPLIRDVLIISREGRNGLGTGFASFVAGDQGQRLIRLMGMLPATMPVRIIKIN